MWPHKTAIQGGKIISQGVPKYALTEATRGGCVRGHTSKCGSPGRPHGRNFGEIRENFEVGDARATHSGVFGLVCRLAYTSIIYSCLLEIVWAKGSSVCHVRNRPGGIGRYGRRFQVTERRAEVGWVL